MINIKLIIIFAMQRIFEVTGLQTLSLFTLIYCFPWLFPQNNWKSNPIFYLDNARKHSNVLSCFLIGQQAVWFTSEQGLDGPVYGAADQWNGIGVFFDSFDNDGKVGVSVIKKRF